MCHAKFVNFDHPSPVLNLKSRKSKKFQPLPLSQSIRKISVGLPYWNLTANTMPDLTYYDYLIISTWLIWLFVLINIAISILTCLFMWRRMPLFIDCMPAWLAQLVKAPTVVHVYSCMTVGGSTPLPGGSFDSGFQPVEDGKMSSN